MALSKIRSESVDLTDDFAFTGTVTGAGKDWTKTAQTTTSGAATFTFSGIPSDVTEIVAIGTNVSRTSGSGHAGIRLGDSGGLETTGYNSNIVYSVGGAFYENNVTDLGVCTFSQYDDVSNFVCRCWNTTGNKWMMQIMRHTPSGSKYWSAVTVEKELSGTLDRVGIYASANFDGGTFQLWYK